MAADVEQLLRDMEARIMRHFDGLKTDVQDVRDDLKEAKEALAETEKFQTAFQGVARTLLYVVIVLGGIITIYAAFHGITSGNTK